MQPREGERKRDSEREQAKCEQKNIMVRAKKEAAKRWRERTKNFSMLNIARYIWQIHIYTYTETLCIERKAASCKASSTVLKEDEVTAFQDQSQERAQYGVDS